MANKIELTHSQLYSISEQSGFTQSTLKKFFATRKGQAALHRYIQDPSSIRSWFDEIYGARKNPLSGPQEYMIGLGVLAAGALGIYLVHRNSAVTPPPLQSGPVPSANPYVLVTNVNPQTATSSTIALPTGATWGQGPTTGYAGGAQGTTAPIILAAGTYPLYWVAPDGSGQITNVIVS